MTIVSPSLLAADFLHLDNEIEMINRSEAEWLHLDVMDGVFVPISPSVSPCSKPWQRNAPKLSTCTT